MSQARYMALLIDAETFAVLSKSPLRIRYRQKRTAKLRNLWSVGIRHNHCSFKERRGLNFRPFDNSGRVEGNNENRILKKSGNRYRGCDYACTGLSGNRRCSKRREIHGRSLVL